MINLVIIFVIFQDSKTDGSATLEDMLASFVDADPDSD